MEKVLEIAIHIAVNAHYGIVDKAGKPYIFHPFRVMNSMDSIEEKIVAILHDVIEDTYITASDLRQAGIPENLIVEILALTHDAAVDYDEYVKQISGYKIASKVKLADLKDNMDITRYKEITDRDLERLKKYHRNYIYLKNKPITDD